MVFVPPKDRVLELSTSNSQSVFALAGAVDTSYNRFNASMAVADTTIGAVVEAGVAFKTGKLTYSATNEITIDSSVGESKGTFSAGGTKEVFMGLPAAYGAPAILAPQGRLTLASGVPVMLSTQSAKTTLYYTPYVGNQIPIWDGFRFVPRTFAEFSVATTDTTKNPAAIGASKVNDWFVWDDAGTLRLCHGPDWTNTKARSAGTALASVNGIFTNNVSITNGPAANRGTYVGTTYSDASSQLNWIMGGSAANGIAALLSVWNCYNRRLVGSSVLASSSHSYGSGARQWAGVTTMQATVVCGLTEDTLFASFNSDFVLPASFGSSFYVGIGFDSTTAYALGPARLYNNAAGQAVGGSLSASGLLIPGAGVSVISLNENGDAVNTVTANSTGTANLSVQTMM